MIPAAAIRQGCSWLIGTTRCDRTAARADPTVRVERPPHPGPPAELAARQRLDRHRQVEPGQPAQLLGDHGRLQLALQAPARRAGSRSRRTRPGPKCAQGAVDPARVGVQHLDRLAAAERARPGLGDPHQRPLPRQREPDEDHPAVVPGHAVPAVRDRPDVQLDLDPGGELVGGRSGSAGSAGLTVDRVGSFVAVPDAEGTACPPAPSGGISEPGLRPRTYGVRSARSRIRSSSASDDDSCHGTEVTMTPGVNSSRPLSRSALWLCSRCSHQWPTTYSGMKTVTTSRGEFLRARRT